MSQETIIVKKYSNRRLYDTSQSVYITLEQLAEMIHEGKRVQVLEAGSGDDVTAYILTQVLVEEARKKKFLLPVDLLHLMIRYGDNLMGDFFDGHLGQTIENYVGQRNAFEDQFRSIMKVSTNFSEMARNSMDQMTRGAANPFAMFTPPTGEKKDES